MLTGTGDVLEPEATGEGSVMGIGSGGNYALAAGRALLDTDLDAETIARRSLDDRLARFAFTRTAISCSNRSPRNDRAAKPGKPTRND